MKKTSNVIAEVIQMVEVLTGKIHGGLEPNVQRGRKRAEVSEGGWRQSQAPIFDAKVINPMMQFTGVVSRAGEQTLPGA